MDETKKECDIFSHLAETMMLQSEDGEKMSKDIIKIRETIKAISPTEGKETFGPEMLTAETADELRNDDGHSGNSELLKDAAGYSKPYNKVPRVV